MPEQELARLRRREATRTILSYFVMAFLAVSFLTGLAVYAVLDARASAASAFELRVEYCREIEKLKTANREEVAEAKKNFPRTLRILNIEDTAEVRRVAEEGWKRDLERNAPKPCPYEP